MAMLIENPQLEEELKARRQAWGADQHDEVWEGVYFMPPMANDDHQDLVFEFAYVLGSAISKRGLGKVRPGVNLAASAENWEYDYRVPDVVVFLNDTEAENHSTFWTGPADFVVEIASPRDRSFEKLLFYSRIGVRELLIVDREPWRLDLYRYQDGTLEKVGESSIERQAWLLSKKLSLEFRLIAGRHRPQVEVRHETTDERWIV